MGTAEGKKKGMRFENLVRKQLISEGWIVGKWNNKIVDGELVASKSSFNPFSRKMIMNSGGFPDFIAFRRDPETQQFIVIGVESKYNGYLRPDEREQCNFYLERKIFDKILIARHSDDGIFFVTYVPS